MRQHHLSDLFPKICQLAGQAGKAVMQIYDDKAFADVVLENKADDSPLTLADMASHHTIVNGLTTLTPEIPVVSEEDTESLRFRTPKGFFWLIDPLDGTKEFLARNGQFTVNIALIEDGEPVWGVVDAPALGELFWGGKDFGSFRQVESGTTSLFVSAPAQSGQKLRVVASKSHLNAETSAFIVRLGAVELIQAGSSLKFCRIAEGNADVYPRLAPTCEWDTAAAQAVVEGAGGQVYDMQGARLLYGKPDLLNPSFIASAVSLSQLEKIL